MAMKSLRIQDGSTEYNVEYWVSLNEEQDYYLLVIQAWDIAAPKAGGLNYHTRIKRDFIKEEISPEEDIEFIEDVFAELVREHFPAFLRLKKHGESIMNVNTWMKEAKETIS
jgi:hypothetical protein